MLQKGWQSLCGALRHASARVRVKHLCIAAGVLFLASLIPILLLARYSYPLLDDFVFSENTHAIYEKTGSLWQTLVYAAQTSRDYYTAWQGTFVACALFALQPGLFGAYPATTLLMLLSLCAGTVTLVWVAGRRLLKADGWTTTLVALGALFLSVHQMPDANQGLYWYNSAVFYVLFHGLSLLLYAFALLYATTPGKGRFGYLAAATVFAFIVSGGNYVTGLLSLLCMAGLLVALLVQKHRGWLGLCLPFVVLTVGFAINMAAPGNGVRAAQQGETPGFVRAVYESFKSVFVYLNEWTYLAVLLVLALLVPILWRLVGGAGFSFRLPLLFTAASLCLLAGAMFPHIYATAHYGPGRLLNIVFFWYVLLAIGNLAYWLGWARHKLARWQKAEHVDLQTALAKWTREHSLAVLALAAVLAGMMLVLPGKLNKQLTAVQAAQTLRSGEAAAFAAGMAERTALAEAAGAGEGLTVPAIPGRPDLLTFEDSMLTTNPEAWVNVRFARYYGLDWVAEEPVSETETDE